MRASMLTAVLVACCAVFCDAFAFLGTGSAPRSRGFVSLAAADDRDIIERLWDAVFGEKEKAPFGLKRYTKDQFPDNFRAILNEFAKPVSGDDKDVALFRPLLKQTCLETRKLTCAYDANRNGWSADAFHKRLDKKGPAVLLAKSKGGAVFGGYNAKGWAGYGELRPGISSFLFTWPDGKTNKQAIKLRKVGGAGVAVSEKGPIFGSDSLAVPMTRQNEKLCQCNLGPYYEKLPGEGRSLFAPSEGRECTLTDLKVFVGVWGPNEPIPFSDAISFSLS